MEVTESLKNSLEALNNLSAGHLAHKIFTYGLPPVGWCLDVYMRNGEIYFSDYYTGGTAIKYEPDEVLIATLDNTHGDLEPDENYAVGDTWELREEIIEKYRDRFPRDLRRDELQYRIWTECMDLSEKEEEYQRMADFFWHGEYETFAWLGDRIEEAINEIEARLAEGVREERK